MLSNVWNILLPEWYFSYSLQSNLSLGNISECKLPIFLPNLSNSTKKLVFAFLRLILDDTIPCCIELEILLCTNHNKGPSKNYVTTKEGGGQRFRYTVTYILSMFFFGGGVRGSVILWNSFVTTYIQFENSKEPYLVSLLICGIIEGKKINEMMCQWCLKYHRNQKFAYLLFLLTISFRNRRRHKWCKLSYDAGRVDFRGHF